MKIRILIFGKLAELIGKSQLEMALVEDTDSLMEILFDDFPELRNQEFVLSLGRQIVKSNQKINQEDEVALLPPFAGG